MDLDALERKAEKQKEQKARIAGRIESLKESLGKEGFKSIKAAKAFVSKTKSTVSNMEKTFDLQLGKFKEKYAEHIKK